MLSRIFLWILNRYIAFTTLKKLLQLFSMEIVAIRNCYSLGILHRRLDFERVHENYDLLNKVFYIFSEKDVNFKNVLISRKKTRTSRSVFFVFLCVNELKCTEMYFLLTFCFG